MDFRNFFIFASGNGSNTISLIKYAVKYDLPLKGIITDNEDAPLIEKVLEYDIPLHIIPYEGSKKNHESKILEVINTYDASWICLAGYMRILSKEFLAGFHDNEFGISRVINIHPSLLPSFPGPQSYQAAFDYGVKLSGITIHFVDEEVDNGAIIYQQSFERYPNDSINDFKVRGQAIEHEVYPRVLDKILNKNFTIENLGTRKVVHLY